jgi:hypothetical protein
MDMAVLALEEQACSLLECTLVEKTAQSDRPDCAAAEKPTNIRDILFLQQGEAQMSPA